MVFPLRVTTNKAQTNLVSKGLCMKVNSVHVYFVAHSDEIPVNFLALSHLQSMEVPI